jgi:hypothetical protein
MNQSINERDLNASQFERLKTLYVETFVNSMSHEDLLIYVTNDMEDFCKELSNQDLIEEIKYTLDEEMLEEFVNQIRGNIYD